MARKGVFKPASERHLYRVQTYLNMTEREQFERTAKDLRMKTSELARRAIPLGIAAMKRR